MARQALALSPDLLRDAEEGGDTGSDQLQRETFGGGLPNIIPPAPGGDVDVPASLDVPQRPAVTPQQPTAPSLPGATGLQPQPPAPKVGTGSSSIAHFSSWWLVALVVVLILGGHDE